MPSPRPLRRLHAPQPGARKHDFHAPRVTDGRVWLLQRSVRERDVLDHEGLVRADEVSAAERAVLAQQEVGQAVRAPVQREGDRARDHEPRAVDRHLRRGAPREVDREVPSRTDRQASAYCSRRSLTTALTFVS